MSFLSLTSALIAAGITIPALLSLYFLKLKRKRMVVSSTLLWKRAIQDMEVNSPFQKLRRNLLLLLQLLLLACLLIAMARPATFGFTTTGKRTILVIDHSGSMNATDVAPTRLDEAKRQALDIVNNLDSQSGGVMIVSFAQNARVIEPFTTDKGRLRQAIQSIHPTDQTSQLDTALRLIEPFAMEAEAAGDQPLAVRIFSDGRVQTDSQSQIALQGASLVYERIGQPQFESIDNVGIVSFSARRDPENPHRVQVYARLANVGLSPVRTTLILKQNDQTTHVQPVELPAATLSERESPDEPQTIEPAIRGISFNFNRVDSGLLHLSIDREDMLKADNEAYILLAPARRLRVLMVSEGNGFLENAIRSVGVRELVVMSPRRYENQRLTDLRRAGWDELDRTSNQGFDLIIFDDYSPKQNPPVNSLFFNAVPNIPDLALRSNPSESPRPHVILDWQRDHPVMRWVVLDDVMLLRPGRLVLPETALILATSQTGPVMAEVSDGRLTHIIASFNVLETYWPLYVSFPVFFDNVLRVLGDSVSAGIAYQPSDVAVAPVPYYMQSLIYQGPDTLIAHVQNERAVLPAFTRAGLYTISTELPEPYHIMPVNMVNLQEGNIHPAPSMEVSSVMIDADAGTGMVRREIWPYFLWAALAFLMIEWLVYTRRMYL